MVCVSKEEGGLDVINLKKHNEALLTKNFDKFFNTRDIPWVSLVWEKLYPNGKLPNHVRKGLFWWRDILKLLHDFKSFSSAQVQNGSTCLFWSDSWIQQPLQLEYPELYSFARNKEISVARVWAIQDLSDLFHLPLSSEAFQQLQIMQSFKDHFPLTNSQDIWVSQWGDFLVKRTYNFQLGHRHIPTVYKWLWECLYQPKHKVFFGCY